MERSAWKSNNVESSPSCPRCGSTNTKFCYYNNYSLTQPRYFCKGCRRYWTKGGSLRNVPVGGGCRKNRRGKSLIRLSNDHVKSTNFVPSFPSKGMLVKPSSSSNGSNIDLAAVYANFLNSHQQPDNSCKNSNDNGLEIQEVMYREFDASSFHDLTSFGPQLHDVNGNSHDLVNNSCHTIEAPMLLSDHEHNNDHHLLLYYDQLDTRKYQFEDHHHQVTHIQQCATSTISELPPLPGEEYLASHQEILWANNTTNDHHNLQQVTQQPQLTQGSAPLMFDNWSPFDL